MPLLVFTKLGICITAPEPISKAYFINTSYQSVSVCNTLLCRSRVGRESGSQTAFGLRHPEPLPSIEFVSTRDATEGSSVWRVVNTVSLSITYLFGIGVTEEA
jgi:hypothetical protein